MSFMDMLSPENIKDEVKRNNISLESAIELLKSTIEQSNSSRIRARSVEIISGLTESGEELFKILEYCLISDESALVRGKAVIILEQYFPEKCVSLLKWAIQNDKSNLVINTMLNFAESASNPLQIVLKEEIEKRILNTYGISGKEARFLFDLELLNPHVERRIQVFNGKINSRIKLNKEGFVVWLDLSRLDIKKIPNSLMDLKRLKKLDLRFNPKIQAVPSVLTAFSKQNLSQKYVNKGVCSRDAVVLGVLETLVGSNLIKRKPPAENFTHYKLDKNENVTNIYIGDCDAFKFETVPKQISKLKYLKTLNLGGNRIIRLPNEIEKLKNLKKLSLPFNALEAFPEVITKIQSLEVLDLQHNYLKEIPESIGNLLNLKKLYISQNSTKKIPDSIGNLKNLECFSISENRIQEIPESIDNLKVLKYLNLDHNPIKEKLKLKDNLKKKLKNLEFFSI